MRRFLGRVADSLRRSVRPRIAIVDDFFPHPISGFRVEEYISYLDEMPGVSIYCDGNSLGLLQPRRPVEELIAEHFAAHRRHIGRIHPIKLGELPDADAYYTIFLHNIARYLDGIERNRKPFAFTLYPGGGFLVEDKESDDKLDRVCRSPWLRKIIVTQSYTRDYLLKKHPQSGSKICYLPGCVVPRAALSAPTRRKSFGIDKDVLDIGFVALRYTPKGEDKGYDLFVETARELCRAGVNARYHVVGPWGADILPLQELNPCFVFHGLVSTAKLRELGQGFDLILSPNRPSVLANGAFDGFPTGSCVEVGLQGAAIACTDTLKMNPGYRDGVDIILVEPNVNDIVKKLLSIVQKQGALAQIGTSGRIRFTESFGRQKQLIPRFAVLRALVTSWDT